MAETRTYTLQDVITATGKNPATIYKHVKFGNIVAEKDGRLRVSQDEFDRVVRSYAVRGFVAPPEYEGWHTIPEMAAALGKDGASVQRYLTLEYIKGVKIKARGRGLWLIDPAAYDPFVARYYEAHDHLKNWHTVKEYAAAVGLSPIWVRDLIRDGRIRADKISRKEAMLVTKDEHTYRIPPEEMETAQQVASLITLNKLRETLTVDGVQFSLGYLLDKVLPAVGIGQTVAGTKRTRVRKDDIPRLIGYITEHSRTLKLKQQEKERNAFNQQVREMTLDTRVLQQPAPHLNDVATLEQEKQLWLLVKQGNSRAFSQLTQTYLPYVYSQTRWNGKGIDIESKVAHGVAGLWFAVMNATSVGDSIRGYAKKYIKGKIKNFAQEERGGRRRRTHSLDEKVGENQTLGQQQGVYDS